MLTFFCWPHSVSVHRYTYRCGAGVKIHRTLKLTCSYMINNRQRAAKVLFAHAYY